MESSAPVPQPQTLPQTWRIPSWQPAALIVFATALLALDIYASLSLGPLVLTVLLAVAALATAGLAVRYQMVADDEGIWVRGVFSEELVEWRDIADIDVTHVRGTTMTVRITRRNGKFVDVPPTLVQPTLPTGVRKARALVGDVARELLDLAAEQRP
ncbi:MAG TPA: PH domain-containing protein [Jatrophihabitantaceae bacterium]|jgi:hypothetical protein